MSTLLKGFLNVDSQTFPSFAEFFVEKLLKRLREAKDILPKPHGGGYPPTLNREQLAFVKALVETHNDATLDELREHLQRPAQILISRSTMGRVCNSRI